LIVRGDHFKAEVRLIIAKHCHLSRSEMVSIDVD
jgi:hypothetical protein